MIFLRVMAALGLLAASSGCEPRALASIPQVAAFGSSFTPRSLANCVVWLRADLGITTVSGAVSVWADQATGSANNATQTNAPSMPTYNASGGLNNAAYLTFTGSSALSWGYVSPTGAHTIMVVMKLTTTNGGGHTAYVIYDGTHTSEMILDLSGYSNTSWVDGWSSGGGSMVGVNDVLGSASGHILLHTTDGLGNATGNYTASLDGTSKTVVTSGAYGAVGTGSEIGARTTGAFTLVANLYEIVVYNRVLSSTEQGKLVAYAKARYGL